MIRNLRCFIGKPMAALFLLAGGLFAATGASAQVTTTGADDKVWTGANCVPAGGNSFSAMKIRPASIENATTVNKYISCAVTVDSEQVWKNAENNGGTDSGYAYLFLTFDFTNAASSTVTCTAQITDGGTIIETFSNSVDGTAGSNGVFLTLGPMYEGTGDGRALGFNCLLPPSVRLNTFNLEEYSDTNQRTVFP